MRFKIRVKDSKLTIKAKISDSYKIQSKEIDIIRNSGIRGLLKPDCKRKRVIEYMGPEGVPIKEFLKNVLSKYDFFNIMYQIIEVVRKVERYGLAVKNIVFDVNHVFINEKTKEMLYIYMPVEPEYTGLNAREFMEQVVLQAEYGEEDIDYVAEFINHVNMLKTFDLASIEKYIAGEEELIGRRIARNNYSYSRQMSKKMGNPAVADDETEMMEERPASVREAVSKVEDDATEPLQISDREIVKPENRKEEGLVSKNPRLVNVDTGEIVYIDKRVFRIGKEQRYVDFFLDIDEISRKHADIITRDSGYYIYDHNSTNHTYVNGRVLPPKEEVEIHDGSIIGLAEEEFTFLL